MKKWCFLIIMALLICPFATPAYAYTDNPDFQLYQVVCPKSVDYYTIEYDGGETTVTKAGTYSAGTELTVVGESEENGVDYVDIMTSADIKTSTASYVSVKRSDVQFADSAFLPEDLPPSVEPLVRSRTVCVTASDGVKLRKGPNTDYSVVTTIPKGTRLTFDIADTTYLDGVVMSWAYVTYQDNSGWIHIWHRDIHNGVSTVPEYEESAEIMALRDGIQIYGGISNGNLQTEMNAHRLTELSEDAEYYAQDGIIVSNIFEEKPDKVVGFLKKGETYQYKYTHDCDFGVWYYVVTDTATGWVFVDNENSGIAVSTQFGENDYEISFDDFSLELYDTPEEGAAEKSVNVSENTVLHPLFQLNREYFYGTVNGQSGWWNNLGNKCASSLNYIDESGRIAKDRYSAYQGNLGGTPIYNSIMKQEDITGIIPEGEHLEFLYRGSYRIDGTDNTGEDVSFFYVQYQDLSGWVLEDDLYNPDNEEQLGKAEEMTEMQTGDPETNEEDAGNIDEKTETNDGDHVAQHSLPSGLITLICIGSAAVLIAAVIIVVVRRKRKASNMSPAEDTMQKDSDV